MNVKVSKEIGGVCVMAIDYGMPLRRGPEALRALILRHDERAASFARGRRPQGHGRPASLRTEVMLARSFDLTFGERFATVAAE